MTLVHSYSHSFSGFAARFSEEEVRSIAQKPGVISVFKDPLLQLHTTRSWDFLKYQIDLEIDLSASSDSDLSTQEYDTIIGIMDTGNTGRLKHVPPWHHNVCVVLIYQSCPNLVKLHTITRHMARVEELR